MLRTVKEIVNKRLLRQKPTTEEYSRYTEALRNLKDSLRPEETEEYNKAHIVQFLSSAFYGEKHLINTAGSIDCAIYQTKQNNSSIEVIIETKSIANQAEFPSSTNLNTKAMQELVLYFMRERFQSKNITLKHLIITNGYDWIFFDAKEFEKYFASDKQFFKLFDEWDNNKTLFSSTKDFYSDIAKGKIDQVKNKIDYLRFDIRLLKTEPERLRFYKVLQPAHLLKESKFADSNQLNTAFYHELLHIIGLEEHKVDGKTVIERKPVGQRDNYSLLENTINQLYDFNNAGDDNEKFDIALNLVITWINRILFLKLLESQLISFHGNKHADEYRFLSIEIVKNYSELNDLFFKVLAVPVESRIDLVKDKFHNIPYLNSSLFEMTKTEVDFFRIAGLAPGEMPFYHKTVLVDNNGHPMKYTMYTLDYLFKFLNAYDFGSDMSDDLTKTENKSLINASVLGLIFEKINGYKDGSVYTPAFITQYICHEAIESSIIKKFNETFGWDCKSIFDIQNKEFDKDIARKVLDDITICDPAVGSGHFLVSALNYLIYIRSELGLLVDGNGRRIKDYNLSIENDEILLYDEDGEFFHYNPKSPECLRIQKALFELKKQIIENNLFGVDVNPNSVNICRLRLWIELLKNSYYREDTHELETLPNIDINIKNGNSLVSRYPVRIGFYGGFNDKKLIKYIEEYKAAVKEYKSISNKEVKREIADKIDTIKAKLMNISSQLELFSGKTKVDKKEELICNLNPLEWMLEFPEVLDEEGKFIGFDIVIGNPPYIEAKKLKNQSPALKGHYDVYSGTADLSVYFIELALKLTKEGGQVCYITTNKFFSTEFGKPVRSLILRNTITHLINFEQVEVFENVLVSSVILGITKDHYDDNSFTYHQFYQMNHEQIKSNFDIEKESFENFEQSNLGEDEWSFATGASAELKRKLDALPRLGKLEGVHIYRGVTTGFNPAFIITNEQRYELIAKDPKNAEIIKNMLQGRNIRKWYYNESDENLIFTRKGINIDDYPSIKQHLLRFYDQLKPKTKSDDPEGRKPGSYKWYEILDNTAYYHHFERAEKVIWGLTAAKWTYTLDTEQHYLPSNAYILTSDILPVRFILGLLNSKVLHQYFKYIGVMTAGGAYTLKAATIEAMPIPESSIEQQQPIIDLVNTILSKKQRDKEADVSIEETAINKLVYDLYGLTEEERKLIEESK